MKQAQNIYNTNSQAINFLLISKGYSPSFAGLLEAIKEQGDLFLVQLYNEVTSSFDEADGNFWPKFKALFHKATGIAGGVDKIINRDQQETVPSLSNDEIEKQQQEKNKKLLLYAGLAALGIIILLIIIYIFKK